MIRCRLCGCAVPDVEAAIDNDWVPSCWLNDDREICDPICADCSDKHLVDDDTGSVVKPDSREFVLAKIGASSGGKLS